MECAVSTADRDMDRNPLNRLTGSDWCMVWIKALHGDLTLSVLSHSAPNGAETRQSWRVH